MLIINYTVKGDVIVGKSAETYYMLLQHEV